MDSGAQKYSENIQRAITALQNGEMILLFDMDGREAETDFTIAANAVTPADVRWMRKDAGGLICVALDSEASEELGLPFMADIVREANQCSTALSKIVEKGGDLKYDSRSSFSIWVNHRDTRTGIPDNDRALTINKLGEIVDRTFNGEEVHFGSEFRTPGHVATLRAAKGLVHERMGQTELSIALAKIAGITPAMVVCEMLDDQNGRALAKNDAKQYGEAHNLVFVEGEEVVEAYDMWLTSQSRKT
ncbi:3,4-dihydroxy-2-butanone-4-phosphate synthase [Methanolobus psychrotolerans]|uniref:3,4-dihydroxy-2-butanone-4-phosphate synthase n=1 Tax=Methanolobus psychrotolerans TaxID=1874706 RepID=UPI00101AE847|nr:3,4-dihydroxy-2-butanone-4-phosphate synthase [Methanolobus psychrotolerans]